MLDDFICGPQSDECIPEDYEFESGIIIDDEDFWYSSEDDNWSWFSDDEDYGE